MAALCSFRDLNNGEVILVVNMHLFWSPDCVDIKLLQATTLLRRISEVAANCTDIAAVLVCRDFSSTPDCAAFKLLTSRKFDLPLNDCLPLSKANMSYIKNILIVCRAVLRLSSAYYVANDINPDPVADRFSGLIDHILDARLNRTNKRVHLERIVSLSTLSLPTLKEIEEVGIHALPSRDCPSDHLHIASTINFTTKDK